MYARTTDLIADPSRIDAGIAFIRDEIWPTLGEMPGCLGMSEVVDRQTGRCIATTSWADATALSDSAQRVVALRDSAVDIMAARDIEVQEWEVAIMHRAHPAASGACVRAAWSRIDPARADATIAIVKEQMLPRIEGLEGFASMSLLVDRSTGLGVSSVAFDSREALERTREQAAQLRAMGSEVAGVEFLDVVEFELAFAHLHVPELV